MNLVLIAKPVQSIISGSYIELNLAALNLDAQAADFAGVIVLDRL